MSVMMSAMSSNVGSECKWLRKYTAENGSWLDLCESEEPDEEEEGLFKVTIIETDRFDSSECLNFKRKVDV